MSHLFEELNATCAEFVKACGIEKLLPTAAERLLSGSLRSIERGLAEVERYVTYAEYHTPHGTLPWAAAPISSDGFRRACEQLHRLIADIYRALPFETAGGKTAGDASTVSLLEELAETKRKLAAAESQLGALSSILHPAGNSAPAFAPPPYAPPKAS